jgi:hypothetical protein
MVLLLLAVSLLTGCSVQVATDTKVNEDGSGTVGLSLAADKELQDAIAQAAGGIAGPDSFLGGLGDILQGVGGILGRIGGVFGLPSSIDEVFDYLLGEISGEWQMDRGTDDEGRRYVDLSRPFADPEEYEEIINEGTLSKLVRIDEVSLAQESGTFRTRTVFFTTASAGDAVASAQSRALGITEKLLGDALVIENRLTLPGTVTDHNADEVRGDMLVWKVGLSGSRQMYAESVSYHWGPIIAVVIAALVIIAGITVALVLILRRRRRPNPPVRPSAVHPAPAPMVPPSEAAPAPDEPADAEPGAAEEPEAPVIELVPMAADEEAAGPHQTGAADESAPAAPPTVVPIPRRPDKAPAKTPDPSDG